MIVLGDKDDIPTISAIATGDTVRAMRELAYYAIKAIELNKSIGFANP
jgi:hypothetical protein